MAERKATNKYYPPDWDPSKGSINKYVGQHPLRERARKLSEGILIIRFELPFNIWCSGCERHLARGVRFNAEKKQIGKYYSTAIFSFRMKCPSCSNWIEIHTDPKNSEYLVVAGARRKMEDYSAEEAGIGGTRLSREDSEKLETNPFFRLEHEAKDERRAKEQLPRLQSLLQSKDSIYKNDWSTSRKARSTFRESKKRAEEELKAEEAFKNRSGGLSIKLLSEHVDDKELAKEIDFSPEFQRSQQKRKLLKSEQTLKTLEGDPKASKLKNLIKPKSVE